MGDSVANGVWKMVYHRNLPTFQVLILNMQLRQQNNIRKIGNGYIKLKDTKSTADIVLESMEIIFI